MNYQATIGTISHGTHLPGDLLEAFADELGRLDHGNEHKRLVIEATELIDFVEADPESFDTTIRDAASEMVDELIEALDEFAPPFCYFGAHEGDGSDFGFWPSMEAVDDAVAEGSALKVDAGGEVLEHLRAHGSLPEFIVEVNDHGNVSVYRITGVETELVWDCV